MFASPLLVVVAAYLAVHSGGQEWLRNRTELLEGLAAHEDRYWEATAAGLGTDEPLRRRIVALASLAGARGEGEASELLRLVPDLAEEGPERRRRLARWAHELYPGPRWWNPVEPDLLGEHPVASCYSEEPAVLAGVLDRPSPGSIVQPLDTFARAAPDHPELAAALGPVVSEALVRLCRGAVEQVRVEKYLDLVLGNLTLAGAIERTLATVAVDPNVFGPALRSFPLRPDLVNGPLALMLASQLLHFYRPTAEMDPAAFFRKLDELSAPVLGYLAFDASCDLEKDGHHDEALAFGEHAVTVFSRLAATDPPAYEPDLAVFLDHLSVVLRNAGRHDEALAAAERAVPILRRLAAESAAIYERNLAMSLINLSLSLAEAGQREEAKRVRLEAAHVNERLCARRRVRPFL